MHSTSQKLASVVLMTCIGFSVYAGEPNEDIVQSTPLDNPYTGRLIMSYSADADVILGDIPGRIGIEYKDSDGNTVIETYGDKVLKNVDGKLPMNPSVTLKETLIQKEIVTKNVSASAKFLSFVKLDSEDEIIVKFEITRFATARIIDDDIDWPAVHTWLEESKKYEGFPQDAKVFVVQVASSYKTKASVLTKKTYKASASGFGITSGGKYFASQSDEKVDMKVLLTPLYPRQFGNLSINDESKINQDVNDYLEQLESFRTQGLVDFDTFTIQKSLERYFSNESYIHQAFPEGVYIDNEHNNR